MLDALDIESRILLNFRLVVLRAVGMSETRRKHASKTIKLK